MLLPIVAYLHHLRQKFGKLNCKYHLEDYISLVYFNPDDEKYDTLKSSFIVNVIGESKKNVSISSNDLGSFYNIIDIENNTLKSINNAGIVKLIANIFIVVMLGLTLFFILRK